MKNRGTGYANAAIILIAALMYAALVSPFAVTGLSGRVMPVYRSANNGEVALQCLMIWDAESAEEILSVLKEHNVRITFAMTREWAERNTELLRRMSADGHETAVLGMPDKETLLYIESVTGTKPSSCVMLDDAAGTYSAARSLGLDAVRCTLDLDTANGSAEEIAKRLEGSVSGGSIISVLPTREFLAAIPEITEKIKNMGLDIVPTHKMLYN